jgi:thiamine pyrophosphokinase
MKTALLALNGRPCSAELCRELAFVSDLVACADGGFNWLSQTGVNIDLVAGDLDSGILPDAYDFEVQHTPNQDLTDFEKILQILLKRGFSHIFVVGANGDEPDHFLSNLMVMYKYCRQAAVILLEDQSRMQFITAKNLSFACKSHSIISLFGWPQATFASSTGLQYPLDDITLDFNRTGSRNIANETGIVIRKKTGDYLLVVNESPLGVLSESRNLFLVNTINVA